MARLKFLHAADLHLDSPLLGLDRYEGAPVEECRGATRRALENLVGLAIEEKVSFVLIAGDLYDGDWHDYNTGLFFSKQMIPLRDAGIPVVLIRGNHDAENRMTRDLRPLDNMKVLASDRPETLTLDDVGVSIHGRSFPVRDVGENWATSYPQATPGLFNIGLLHTCAEDNSGEHRRYAPCTLDDMRLRHYDYWALGHVHRRGCLHAADPGIHFPGNIQGRHVREAGPKGCLLVTVDGGRLVTVEERWLDVVRWEVCRVDASGASDGDDLLTRVQNQLAEALERADGRLVSVRVELGGPCRAHAEVAADGGRWSSEVRRVATDAGEGKVWVEKVVVKTRSPSEREALFTGPVAELPVILEELRADEKQLQLFFEREMDDLRKKLDPKMLEHLEPATLLEQAEAMLLSRLQEQSG